MLGGGGSLYHSVRLAGGEAGGRLSARTRTPPVPVCPVCRVCPLRHPGPATAGDINADLCWPGERPLYTPAHHRPTGPGCRYRYTSWHGMRHVMRIHSNAAVCLYPLVAGRSLVRMWDTAGCGWAGHRTAATGKKVKTQPGRQAAAHTVELQAMVPEDYAKF